MSGMAAGWQSARTSASSVEPWPTLLVTSIKTAEKKPRHGVVESSVLDVCFSFDVGCSTCPQCLDSGVSSIQPLIDIPMLAPTKCNMHGRRVLDVHLSNQLCMA
jgi:hypothetical protein